MRIRDTVAPMHPLTSLAVQQFIDQQRQALDALEVVFKSGPPVPKLRTGFTGTNISQARKSLGMSQSDLAAAMSARGSEHYHQTTISKIENEVQDLTFRDAVVLSSILNIQLA